MKSTSRIMSDNDLNSFVELMSSLFKKSEGNEINEKTDIKALAEWSSLQTMIVVNEIDRKYNVLLETDDFKNSSNLKQIFDLIQSKKS